MCTYHFLHYHHVAPCQRSMVWQVYYSFCPSATIETSIIPIQTSATTSSTTNSIQNEQRRQPCPQLAPAPDCDPVGGTNYMNPCAAGGCLTLQDCASGGCRLAELRGRWICCRCERGGNIHRLCMHRVRRVPDALCSHVVCQNCRIDE
ncbi:hypothetical protein GGS21DRAFT_34402 [Xylaria nigripes]|nr:hypothetical protein GGS21DRAFT_34402 [Xylaria nigripes]